MSPTGEDSYLYSSQEKKLFWVDLFFYNEMIRAPNMGRQRSRRPENKKYNAKVTCGGDICMVFNGWVCEAFTYRDRKPTDNGLKVPDRMADIAPIANLPTSNPISQDN